MSPVVGQKFDNVNGEHERFELPLSNGPFSDVRSKKRYQNMTPSEVFYAL